MPRPTHRIDLIAVPAVPDSHPIEGARALMAELLAEGVVTPDGRPGPRASRWMSGQFARIRLDEPGAVTLYANRLGGFRVACPTTRASIVPAFGRAMHALRAGGERVLRCPSCGSEHALEELAFAPPAAFASLAVITADAGAAVPDDEVRARVEDHLGPTRWIAARV
jgi:hypothetical protein